MAHPFLSDAWFDAVDALRDRAPAPPDEIADIAVNMVVGAMLMPTPDHLAFIGELRELTQ